MLSLRDKKWKDSKSTKLIDGMDDNVISETFSELGLSNKVSKEHTFTITENQQEQIERAMKLVEMYNVKRADDYTAWLRVGWALHNTHPTLLDTWIAFSKRSKKFKDGECEQLWQNMKKHEAGLTIRSLMLWAKEDSPDEYRQYNKEHYNNILKKNSENNTYSIGTALYHKYNNNFVCTNIKDNEWYEFKNHGWNRCTDGELIKLMSSDFVNDYLALQVECLKKANKADTAAKKVLMEQAKNYENIANKLMNINFKTQLMKEARYMFLDMEFKEKLNENHFLIRFTNGVYDLHSMKFRDGQADDHITLSTGVFYKPYNEDNPYMKHINTFFKKILPNEGVRKYFIRKLANCVCGHKNEHKIFFCLGDGSNGKSIVFKLMKLALGQYYITCPIALLTKKRGQSSAASPETIRMKGPRCGVYQEPGTDETMNVGILKELSGNDSIVSRGLFQDLVEFVPQLTQFITMNELPNILSADGGTWRRIRVIDFPSLFKTKQEIDQLKKTGRDISNVFLADDGLEAKLEQWAPAFASFLIHTFITERNNKEEPDEVKGSTDKYRLDQDTIREFVESQLIQTNEKSDTVMKKELQTRYREWHNNNHSGETMPKGKKIGEFIEKEYKVKYTKTGYRYFKFVDDEEDEESQHSDDEDESSHMAIEISV
jgi:P4 family phage/plasmid primase-like protien